MSVKLEMLRELKEYERGKTKLIKRLINARNRINNGFGEILSGFSHSIEDIQEFLTLESLENTILKIVLSR
jgi:hypothetical protein